MVNVFLHGKLGQKFGKEWKLDISSPLEAIKAIDANKEGFLGYLLKKSQEQTKYMVFVDKKPLRSQDELKIQVNKEAENIHFFMVPQGGIGMILGGLLGMFGGWGAGALGSSIGGFWGGLLSWGGNLLFEIGGAVLMQGLMDKLVKEPDPPEMEDSAPKMKSTSSFTFSRPINNITQGARVPVGYGRLRVGSTVISSSVMNCRLNAFDYLNATIKKPDGSLEGAVIVDQYTES
jgi:predicted phage tail protein